MSTGSERRRARAAHEDELAPPVPVPVPEVVWHDLECGSASTDLPLWEELAEGVGGPILELGCGTGRVGLHLAKAGHEVIGVDRHSALVAAFNERAARDQLDAQAMVADILTLQLRRAFGLVIAPMQVIQQVGGANDRMAALRAAAAHVAPAGRAGFAIVESGAWAEEDAIDVPDPLPDVREVEGWVFSSRPLGVKPSGRGVIVERFRERVDPRGEIATEHHADHIDALDAEQLEQEAGLARLSPAARRAIHPDPGHAPSVAVILEGQ